MGDNTDDVSSHKSGQLQLYYYFFVDSHLILRWTAYIGPRCRWFSVDRVLGRADALDRSTTAVAVRNEKLSPNFLGRRIDRRLVHELEVLGLDASGENGEVHTLVTGGPLFSRALQVYGVEKLAVADCTLLRLELAGGFDSPRPSGLP